MPKIIVNGQSVEAAIAGAASAGSIPIGGIIPWMSPTVGAPQPAAPTGFEYCDGTVVATAGPMFGFTKPALMKTVGAPGVSQRMVRGGNTGVAYGGATALAYGGADTHGHGGSTDTQGFHSHNVSSHTHSISGESLNTGFNTLATAPVSPNGGVNNWAENTHTHPINTHSHGGNTGYTGTNTDGQGSHGHNIGTTSAANIPFYVELAWIIRCV